jgi:hypothetical protein
MAATTWLACKAARSVTPNLPHLHHPHQPLRQTTEHVQSSTPDKATTIQAGVPIAFC